VTLDLLDAGLIDNARVRGDQALDGLRPLLGLHPKLVRAVRGKGLMIGIEFDTAEHAHAVELEAFRTGLLVLECGRSTVRMCPALTVSEAEMATGLRIFAAAVATVAAKAADQEARPEPRGTATASRIEAAG